MGRLAQSPHLKHIMINNISKTLLVILVLVVSTASAQSRAAALHVKQISPSGKIAVRIRNLSSGKITFTTSGTSDGFVTTVRDKASGSVIAPLAGSTHPKVFMGSTVTSWLESGVTTEPYVIDLSSLYSLNKGAYVVTVAKRVALPGTAWVTITSKPIIIRIG